jgi:hypothetical protein
MPDTILNDAILLHELRAGDVFTAAHATALQALLNEHNDQLGAKVDEFARGREQGLHECAPDKSELARRNAELSMEVGIQGGMRLIELVRHRDSATTQDADKTVIAELTLAISRGTRTSKGVLAIAMERSRQISKEGWSDAHDDHEHRDGELVAAAICYAQAGTSKVAAAIAAMDVAQTSLPTPQHWPWENSWWKPAKDPTRNLEKAGALIAAEIDRRKRAAK